MSQRFTMTAADLTHLVTMVSHAASTDDTLPAFRCLKFTIGPGADHLPHFTHRTFAPAPVRMPMAISAAATDRFRLAWATAPCEATSETALVAPVEFMLRGDMLRKMLAAFPKQARRRPSDPPFKVVIEVLDSAVQFTVGGVEFEQATTLARTKFDFPKLDKVVVFDTEVSSTFAVDPRFAAEMFTAFTKVRRYREAIAVSTYGEHKPVRFSMDNDGDLMASGMLMPVKGP
jgi:DNA polymerase III sliding clamp (beta) subunit (PCNA family)